MINPEWFDIALYEYHNRIHEFPNEADNPRILEYLSTCNGYIHKSMHDETPWCSAFVNWCLYKAGYKGTNNLMARSWCKWGIPIVEELDGEVIDCEHYKGAIVVLSRGNDKRYGHVGFLYRASHSAVQLLGGNQHNQVSFAHYPRSRIVAVRYPHEVKDILK